VRSMGHLWPSRSWESHTPASPRPWLDMLRKTRTTRSSSVAIIPFVSDGRRLRKEHWKMSADLKEFKDSCRRSQLRN